MRTISLSNSPVHRRLCNLYLWNSQCKWHVCMTLEHTKRKEFLFIQQERPNLLLPYLIAKGAFCCICALFALISAFTIYDPDNFMVVFQLENLAPSDLYALATFCIFYASIYMGMFNVVMRWNPWHSERNFFWIDCFSVTHVSILTIIYSLHKSMKNQQKNFGVQNSNAVFLQEIKCIVWLQQMHIMKPSKHVHVTWI